MPQPSDNLNKAEDKIDKLYTDYWTTSMSRLEFKKQFLQLINNEKIAENNYEFVFNCSIDESEPYQRGFRDAVDQMAKTRENRIATLKKGKK